MFINDIIVKRWNQLANDAANAAATLIPVVIQSGESLSSAADLQGLKIVAFALPSAFTAASLSFQISYDNSTWYELLDSNRYDLTNRLTDMNQDPLSLGTKSLVLVHYGQASGGVFTTGAAYFARAGYIKIRSGAGPENPVTQGADRVIQVVCMSHGASLQY